MFLITSPKNECTLASQLMEGVSGSFRPWEAWGQNSAHETERKAGNCWGGFRLIRFLFFRGILSVIGYGFDSLGDRVHSHFPPALP